MQGQRGGDSAEHNGDRELAEELKLRLEQQAVVTDLGRKALTGSDLQKLMSEAASQVARAFDVDLVNVLELLPGRERLVLRAGVGWREGLVGTAEVDAGTASPAGFALLASLPVILDDASTENRFRLSPLLREHGAVCGLSVIIPSTDGDWGVLGVYSTHPRRFSRHDVSAVQAIANIIGDAVERRRSEETQAHLAAIVESSYDAIFRKTTDGVVTSWNAAAQRMYGYSPDEIVGKRVDILFPPELKHTLADIMATIRQGESLGVHETVRVRKDGSRIPISLTVSPILDGQGNIVAASTIAHDISDRKRAEDALRKAHDELEKRVEERTGELRNAIEELEGFTYAVSHDLRAPLRAIDGFARLVLEDYGEELADEARTALSRVVRGSDRMSQLIDDLLRLSQLSHRRLELAEVDLCDIARRAAAELFEREPDRQIHFEIPRSLIVHGDRRLLEIALTNLLENAWKFSGEERAVITLGSNGSGTQRSYFVQDNGMGFDMRMADKLFVPFQRLHGTEEVEGTGIGLAIVHRVIRRHGGDLWATGEPGKGATFYFTLPESGAASG